LGIEATSESLPEVPQVAVFDTAIHQTMPPKAYLYGLPKEFYTKFGIRRYGFHGTSHGYVARKAAQAIGKPFEELKIITCHLGNGGSITAFLKGKSVDTSMGFTPLEGILMGTRCGDLDPYIPLYIMEVKDMPLEEVNILMNKKAGLLALTGKRDMRDILDEAKKGSVDAINGIEMYVYRIQKYIGAYAAAMNGVDAIVFTAGIGENSSYIRIKVLQNFTYLGLKIDVEANKKNETIISTADSKIFAMAIHTNEELVIATETFEIISRSV
ncbi:MAG: acetate/propionate family kinase, partial [Candidatus Aureabacteria bacterium]|nr:acetate/propionate family kinase [Candidatus Auribacterota bacterium]